MFYIALCDDEWQAVEILTGYLSEIKRSGLQLESVPFLNGREHWYTSMNGGVNLISSYWTC